ncbi:hypothetical protein VUJ46_12150 [Chryseobacterium sp. MYb264]|uniref:hypothetical protein n=1 Tax=Chryseobacterium sp. MYb264 TaxID=2745153 RepID=UPI002E11B93D|nr:hypothetical protein VUJ46_12150 [Chryseobacterium sp. MYb264]
MGKFFFGTHTDKEKAMRIADIAANAYSEGKCYTPASRMKKIPPTFNEITNLWTCAAEAHHHWGSCGSTEITCGHQTGRGIEWDISIPIGTTNSLNSVDADISEEDTMAEPEDYFNT